MCDPNTGEKRQAYADELTDAQLKFMFHAGNERQKMKKRTLDKQRNKMK